MDLSVAQFSTVSNVLSFTIAAMGASALFFFLSRSSVAPKYRPAQMRHEVAGTYAFWILTAVRRGRRQKMQSSQRLSEAVIQWQFAKLS